jgi:hypothetical protein
LDRYSGLAILNETLEELPLLIVSRQLSRDQVLEVLRELDVLEQGLARAPECEMNDCIALGFMFVNKGSIQSILDWYEFRTKKLSTWRYGFSDRLMIADAFEKVVFTKRRIREAEGKSWKEYQEIQNEISRKLMKDWNPLVQLLYTPRDEKPRNVVRDVLREAHAHLRMVRIVAHQVVTGELLEQEDPFGDKLHTTLSGDRLKIWSIGGDGADDGGFGQWTAGKGKDIVLEVTLPKD